VKHKPVKQSSFYKVTGDSIQRIKKYCPRCGDGFILSEHKDRFYCGNCKYMETKKVPK